MKRGAHSSSGKVRMGIRSHVGEGEERVPTTVSSLGLPSFSKRGSAKNRLTPCPRKENLSGVRFAGGRGR